MLYYYFGKEKVCGKIIVNSSINLYKYFPDKISDDLETRNLLAVAQIKNIKPEVNSELKFRN